MIWPERRLLSAQAIIEWANDEKSNLEYGDKTPTSTVEEAVVFLSDIGVATFAKEGTVPPETSTDALRRLGFED